MASAKSLLIIITITLYASRIPFKLLLLLLLLTLTLNLLLHLHTHLTALPILLRILCITVLITHIPITRLPRPHIPSSLPSSPSSPSLSILFIPSSSSPLTLSLSLRISSSMIWLSLWRSLSQMCIHPLIAIVLMRWLAHHPRHHTVLPRIPTKEQQQQKGNEHHIHDNQSRRQSTRTRHQTHTLS